MELDKMIDNILRYESLLQLRAREWEAEYMDLLHNKLLLTMDDDYGHGVDFMPMHASGDSVLAIDMRLEQLDRYLAEAYERLNRISNAYDNINKEERYGLIELGADEDFSSVVRRRALRFALLSGDYQNTKGHENPC